MAQSLDVSYLADLQTTLNLLLLTWPHISILYSPVTTICWLLQAILEDLKQTVKIPSNVLKRQPSLVGAASAAAAIAGVTALVAASAHALS